MKENLNMIQPDLEILVPQKKRIELELAKTFFYFCYWPCNFLTKHAFSSLPLSES